MHIGVPQEIKDSEHRVGMVPAGVRQLVEAGHDVTVEAGAGTGSGIPDDAYTDAGATLGDADDAWRADLVVKIKEPLPDEYDYLTPDKTVFTYFHLAADEELTHAVLDSGVTAIAYETVGTGHELPLLRPMSQVAGRMAPLVGAQYQMKHEGGRGVLPPGIPGVPPGDVTVVGGGTVGTNAARVAAGMGADVTVLEVDQDRMETIDAELPANVSTRISNDHNLDAVLPDTDLLVGAVLVPGAEAPTVVSDDQVDLMPDGSVVVDVAVDQGGCVGTTRPTSHSDPVYTAKGVTHYAVTNMPGAYARTATFALTNATLPYVRALADKGWQDALRDDPALKQGLNAAGGQLTIEPVADAFGLDHVERDAVL